MRPIPKKLRDEMASDLFYKRCCLTGQITAKIEWHHNLIYAGKQVNEKWCILPISHAMHELSKDQTVRERLDWIMVNRATTDELKRYSKAVDLQRLKNRLNRKFGLWNGQIIF